MEGQEEDTPRGRTRSISTCCDNSTIHCLTYPSNNPSSRSTPVQRKGHKELPSHRKPRRAGMKKTAALLTLVAAIPTTLAQTCISLAGSTTCPAFNSSSISTDSTLQGFFPFLKFVTNVASFDQQLRTYVKTNYVQKQYQTLFGCSNIDLSNTNDLYARYTTSVICNSIIQNSKPVCNLSADNSRPLCGDSCALLAQSESRIISDTSLCTSVNTLEQQQTQLRADFITCSLPTNSLSSGTCIEGSTNEPDNCGFGNSTIGLCEYCAAGGLNSTDTCCYSSKAESRCVGVVLPTVSNFLSFASSTSSSSSGTASPTSSPSSSSSAAVSENNKLSGGAIAGIVIGSIVALALLGLLIFLVLACLRRRRGSQNGSVFNQPSPSRNKAAMAYHHPTESNAAPAGYEILPGGRIARMSALEGHSGDSPPRGEMAGINGGAAVAGAAAGYAAGRRRQHDQSSSDEYGDSPNSDIRGGVLRPPPTSRRQGSLSSGSALGLDDPHSPLSGSGGEMSSPQGVASQQSEQLPYFKDYYSQDEIHPGEKVATLWAYQPRAADEFMLERGDMLKIVGIWDDGWATGVMIDESAEDWELKRNQRDSGVSSGRREPSPPASGEIKAFPLVCVCLPEHWRKTIEGDGSTETGSSNGPPIMPA